MEYKAEEIVQLVKRLEGARGQNNTRWENLARYFHPAYEGFIERKADGEQLNEQVFDGIGRETSKRLGAFLFTNLTGGHTKWFRLRFKDDAANESKTAKKWLEECADIEHRALQESNFKSTGNEFLRCLPVFGSAAISCMEKIDPTIPDDQFKGLTFSNGHLGSLTFLEDSNSNPTTTFLSYQFTAKQAIEYFGADRVSDKIKKAYDESSTNQFKFIHAVYPRYDDFSEYARILKAGLGNIPAEKKPWASIHVDVMEQKAIKESGFNTAPRAIARWSLAPAWSENSGGAGWGYGIGDDSLPDVQTLNMSKELELQAWEKTIDPSTVSAINNVIGQLQNVRGGLTVVKDVNQIRPYNEGTDWNAIMLKTEEMTQNIRDAWMTDKIFMPDAAAPGSMTAFEFGKRLQEVQKMLGSTLGNLEDEYMDYVVERSFDIMQAKGAFPPPPDEVAGQNLDIEYVGPLALAQRAESVQTAEAWLGMIQALAQTQAGAGLTPDVLDIPDMDKMLIESGEQMGVPTDWIRDEKAVEAARQARAQAQQAAAQAEMQNTQADSVQKLSSVK